MTMTIRACVLLFSFAAACSAPGPSVDAGAVQDAATSDSPSGPESCDGTWVGRVRGRVLDLSGAPPTGRSFPYTICGNACVARNVQPDGSFDDTFNHCYPRGGLLPRPVFIFHGLDRYTDVYFDFVGEGRVRVDDYAFDQPVYVASIDAMHPLTIDATIDQTLTDGAGFELSFRAHAVHPPFGRTQLGVIEAAAGHRTAWPGLATLTDLYALLPDDTQFAVPATLRFPNTHALAAGRAVEIMGVGNATTGAAPYAGTLGRVALGHVLPDGSAIVTDAGQGVSAITWLGYRPL